MSHKNRDEHNRWRNKTVAFRVSPEEDEQLEIFVKLSGLTKQDYITRRLLDRAVVVQGNPRVYKALRDQLAAALDRIGAGGFNMECIKSRPLPHVPFEYYFYVQIVCPAGSTGAGCQTLLDTLTSVCSTLRLLGAFTLDSTEK